jgi:hypothetical protein
VPPEGVAVLAMVGVEAAAVAERALLLRARSRMRWPIPMSSSGAVQSPRV